MNEICLKRIVITEFLNDFNPTNLSNPCSPQINSQLVARGAGGRGEALGIRRACATTLPSYTAC